jgi:hypothetical protein
MTDVGSRFTARFPKAALAALCTSVSWLPSRNKTGSNVSLPTSRTSFSVISANARAADRWRSTLSLKERVVKEASGEPVKKLVVVRSRRLYAEMSGLSDFKYISALDHVACLPRHCQNSLSR